MKNKIIIIIGMFSILSASEITKYVDNVIVSYDNRIMALTSYANKTQTISLWDINNTSLKMIKKFNFDDGISFSNNMVFSHDNRYLAMGVNDYTYIWDTKTKVLFQKILNPYEVSAVEFSHDDKHLVIGSANNEMNILTFDKKFKFNKQIEGEKLGFLEKIFSRARYGTTVQSISYSNNDRYIVASFENSNTKIYDVQQNYKIVKEFTNKEENYIYDIHFTKDGKKFFVSKNDVEIEIFDAYPPFKKIKTVPKKAEEEIYATILSNTNRYYLTSWDYSGYIKVWDIKNNFKNITTLDGHENYTTSVQFYNNDKYIISAGGDDTVKIWEVGTWKEVVNIFLDEKHNFNIVTY